MALIEKSNIRVIDSDNVESISVNPNKSHHSVSVEGLTGNVTVTVVPYGLTTPRELEESLIEENGTAIFVLGAVSQIVLTPINNVAYKISLSSF
jgi:hypothetical protein